MSFEPIKYLDDPPRINFKNPALFEQHYRELVDFVKQVHNKQRELGRGVEYDEDDRVSIPFYYLWLHS